jgi:hypothetical protein
VVMIFPCTASTFCSLPHDNWSQDGGLCRFVISKLSLSPRHTIQQLLDLHVQLQSVPEKYAESAFGGISSYHFRKDVQCRVRG